MGSFVSRYEKKIKQKSHSHEPGLFLVLLFPVAFAFIITFSLTRIVNYLVPWLHFQATPTLHVHHFTYGFFILAASGLLSLIFDGPRAKFFIALLYGVGLGFAFDEFTMWLHLSADSPIRWSYDGFVIVLGSFLVLVTMQSAWRWWVPFVPVRHKK